MSGKANSEYIKKISEKLITNLGDCLYGIILVGSCAWKDYKEKTNDIDFEIIVDFEKIKIDSLEFKQGLLNELSIFKKTYRSKKIDYLSYKSIDSKKKISFHFFNQSNFLAICNKDLCNVSTNLYMRELRFRLKDKPLIYEQRNFSGEILKFEIPIHLKKNYFISSTPLVLIKNGNFYMGLIHDKIMTGRIIYYRDNTFLSSIKHLRDNVHKKFMQEYLRDNSKKLINGFSQIDYIPDKHLSFLIKRYESFRNR
ncbi:MAG: hypothetical protein ACMG6E_02345 [Candidatus Roizmanbacteria bacterium]